MIINVISEVATQLASFAPDPKPASPISDVCASAPTGVAPYVSMILGWVKYGVIAVIIGAGLYSCGALIVGKFAQMGRASSSGASGLLYTVIGAIAFVTIYAILNGIVGNGC